jgi:hypothetical protein
MRESVMLSKLLMWKHMVRPHMSLALTVICLLTIAGCSSVRNQSSITTTTQTPSADQNRTELAQKLQSQMNSVESFAVCPALLYPRSGVTISQMSIEQRRNKFLDYSILVYAKSPASRTNGQIYDLILRSVREFDPQNSPDPWNDRRVSLFLSLCDSLASKTSLPNDKDKRDNLSYGSLRMFISEKFLD